MLISGVGTVIINVHLFSMFFNGTNKILHHRKVLIETVKGAKSIYLQTESSFHYHLICLAPAKKIVIRAFSYANGGYLHTNHPPLGSYRKKKSTVL